MKLRSVGVLTVANGANALLAFALSVVAARLLAPGDFGRLSVMMATSAFLVPSLDFGVNQILTSRVARRRTTTLFGEVLRVRVLVALAVTAGASIAALTMVLAREAPLDSDVGSCVLLTVASAWLLVFTTEQALTQGTQAFRRLALQMTTLNAIRLLLVGTVAAGSASYENVLAAYLAPSIVAGASTTVRYRAQLQFKSSYRMLRSLLPTIGLAGVTVFLTSLLSRLGIWGVALLAGEAAAGMYAVAFQTASLVLTFASALSLTFLPEIATLDKSGRLPGMLASYMRKGIPALLLLIAASVVFSLMVPHIFGPRYAGTSPVTFFLMMGFLVSAFNSPFYLLQVARRRYSYLMKVHVTQVLLLAAGCIALVPDLASLGAALAEAAMRIVVVVVFVAQAFAMLTRERTLPTPSVAWTSGATGPEPSSSSSPRSDAQCSKHH
jgi:O-antigen/teichoic acid export membrane protein